MSTIDTLVSDIYKYLESYSAVTPEQLEDLVLNLSQVISDKLQTNRKPSLSMSSIGKPQRRLRLDLEHAPAVTGQARLKFLYGDILEVLLLWLAKQAGHEVTAQQTRVELDGIIGHNDAIIDGVLVDVKSCSPQSFKKFVTGQLPHNDPFGYLAQIASYKECLGTDRASFLAVDKVSGELCLYEPDVDFDLPNPSAVIAKAKEASTATSFKELPKCYEDVPAGKSGNRKLASGCKYCPHKNLCWDNLRVFLYSKGPEYFTEIVKEPSDKIKELIENEETEQLEQLVQ